MKSKIINKIKSKMKLYLDENQLIILDETLKSIFKDYDIVKSETEFTLKESKENSILLMNFLASKHVEGCSERTITYYHTTIEKMLNVINKKIEFITTDDLRKYLVDYRKNNEASKTTVDNIRRVLSSFFSWLEDEDYILKNPVRRIHKIKTKKVVKEVLSDENFEVLRDNCNNIRDLAIIELLASTGIRVGELVNLNIDDVLFNESRNVLFTLMQKQKYTCKNIWSQEVTQILHFLYHLKSHIIDWELMVLREGFENWVVAPILKKCILINLEEQWQQMQLIKECQ